MTEKIKELNRYVLEIEKILDNKNKVIEHILDVITWADISDTTKILKIKEIIGLYLSENESEPTTADEFNEAQIQEGEDLMKEFHKIFDK